MATLRIELQFARLALDLIEHCEVPQALLGNFAAMIGVQVVQFSARVRHATRFDHPAIEECLVARVIIADELSYPVSQELAGMHSVAAIGKVVDDRLKLIV